MTTSFEAAQHSRILSFSELTQAPSLSLTHLRMGCQGNFSPVPVSIAPSVFMATEAGCGKEGCASDWRCEERRVLRSTQTQSKTLSFSDPSLLKAAPST